MLPGPPSTAPPPARRTHMHTTETTDADAPVRATDNDAALARLSAVQKRYLTDPFITAFVPRAHFQQPRPPLINIGTYLRAQGIDELVDGWMGAARQRKDDGQVEGKVQIVSLGAGSDTRFWRLAVRCLSYLMRWERIKILMVGG